MTSRLRSAGIVAASVVLTVVVALLDRATVASSTAAGSVRLGGPATWLVQDQSSLDPVQPSTTRLLSPWENPTTVAWPAFLADVALWAAALALAWWLLERALRTRRSRNPVRTAPLRAG